MPRVYNNPSPKRTIATRKRPLTPVSPDMNGENVLNAENEQNGENLNIGGEEHGDQGELGGNGANEPDIQPDAQQILQNEIEEQRRQQQLVEDNRVQKQREKGLKEQRLLLEAQNKQKELIIRERELNFRMSQNGTGPANLPPPRNSLINFSDYSDSQQNLSSNQPSASNFMLAESSRQTITSKLEYEGLIWNKDLRKSLSMNALELFDDLSIWFIETKNLPKEMNARGGVAWKDWYSLLKRLCTRLATNVEYYHNSGQLLEVMNFILKWMVGAKEETTADDEQIAILQVMQAWGKEDLNCQKIFGTSYTKKHYNSFVNYQKHNSYMFGLSSQGLKHFKTSSEIRSSSKGGPRQHPYSERSRSSRSSNSSDRYQGDRYRKSDGGYRRGQSGGGGGYQRGYGGSYNGGYGGGYSDGRGKRSSGDRRQGGQNTLPTKQF